MQFVSAEIQAAYLPNTIKKWNWLTSPDWFHSSVYILQNFTSLAPSHNLVEFHKYLTTYWSISFQHTSQLSAYKLDRNNNKINYSNCFVYVQCKSYIQGFLILHRSMCGECSLVESLVTTIPCKHFILGFLSFSLPHLSHINVAEGHSTWRSVVFHKQAHCLHSCLCLC